MTDSIPARLAALKTMPMPELKAQWRDLFDTEPPPFNRRHLENRHRLPHPGAGLRRAEARDASGGWRSSASSTTATTSPPAASGMTPGRSPAPGWSASTAASSTPSRCSPTATSGRAGPTARSPPSPAPSPAPAGTAWCSSASSARGARHDQAGHPQAPLRGLHPQVERGGAGAGVQLAARPARGLRGLRRQPALRGLGADPRRPTTTAASPAARWSARRCRRLLADIEEGLVDVVVVYKIDRLSRSLMDFSQARRGLRPRRASPSSRSPSRSTPRPRWAG